MSDIRLTWGADPRGQSLALPADVDMIAAERISDRLQSASHWPTTPATLLDFGTQPPPAANEGVA